MKIKLWKVKRKEVILDIDMDSKRVDCRKCRHYYITWDLAFPYGCRVYELKSKQMPSTIVYKSSGKQCESYQFKDKNK